MHDICVLKTWTHEITNFVRIVKELVKLINLWCIPTWYVIQPIILKLYYGFKVLKISSAQFHNKIIRYAC
jgi:hypothetical protein